MVSNGMKIAVVGGGLAGLAAVMKIAEAGYAVDLFSVVPVKRSHSVCAQGGINGAVNTIGEVDSTWEHFDDTVYGGDFLANQPLARAMCEMAPAIIYLFDRMGVPFSRTKEGLLDFRRFGGTLHHRTAFAGASTGQQLLYALDEQVRRYEVSGQVKKYEHWEMLSLAQDDHGVCRGLVAMERATLELKVFLDGYGVNGENQVYLDLTHIPAETLDRKLGAILEIYEMFVGDDPRHVPMRIFPGVHYSMGGLWVDYDQRTNVPGLLAAGECDYSIHGANRLGAK